MGAWGVNTFDNDTACDWAYDLEKEKDLALVRKAIAGALDVGEEYLESDEACEALAACEVVARLKGNWGVRNAYTETIDKWVETHPGTPPDDLIANAIAAIDRILSAQSELLELWDEDGENKEWHEAMNDLRARVAS